LIEAQVSDSEFEYKADAISSWNMRRNLGLLTLMILHFFADAEHLLIKTKGAKRNSTRKSSGQDYWGRPPPRRPPPPPPRRPARGGGCFAMESLVETSVGLQKMSNLDLGDSVATYKNGQGKAFTKFLGWLDRGNAIGHFIRVTTARGKSMLLTKSHLTFVTDDGKKIPKLARDLKLHDKVLSLTDDKLEADEIVGLDFQFSTGYGSPLTEEGTLLVDGILCSCYSSYDHFWSQIAFAPVKFMPFLFEDVQSQYEEGVRGVVKVIKYIGSMLGLRIIDTEEKLNDNQPWTVKGIVTSLINGFQEKFEL